MQKKDLIIVSAVALVDPDGRVLINKRPEGKYMSGFWEFPGGKVRSDETFEEALSREVNEELNIKINLHEKIGEEKYKDEEIDIILHYYLCSHQSGIMKLNEHENFAWVEKKDFDKYDFAEGDGNMLVLL